MKAMTTERLADIVVATGTSDPDEPRGDIEQDRRDLLEEVRRLRALPVIATCGECSAWDWTCHADPEGRSPLQGDVPPEWCPRRGAQ